MSAASSRPATSPVDPRDTEQDRAPVTNSRRGLSRRISFRFSVIYFVAYALFNGNTATLPLALVSTQGRVPEWYTRPTNRIWAAAGHMLGIKGDLRAFDNADGVGDHLQIVCFLIAAVIGTAVWSSVDRKRLEYRRELELLRVGVRYVLATIVFAYAVFKVFPAQFAVPGPGRLLQTYGQSSPMGLLWTFMGASPGYQMFTGWVELLGCGLLMFRRTTTLGGLVLIGVLTNVGLMDLFYDVPAKLCVLHLLLMASFLVLPSAERLLDVFVLNRAAHPVDLGPPPYRVRLAVKLAMIGLVLYVEGVPAAGYYFTKRDGAPLPALYGAFDVEEMRRNGEVVPPLLTDTQYWLHFVADRRGTTVIMVDGSSIAMNVTFDRVTRRGSLVNEDFLLSVVRTNDDHLVIAGTFRGEPISVRLRPTDPKGERLIRHRMRWFNDGADIH